MLAQRGTGVELGEALSNASIVFMRFQRRINVAELDRLKALRQPQQTTAETQQLGSFLTTPINPACATWNSPNRSRLKKRHERR